MNTVTLTGRLVADPDLSRLPDGTAACKVRLAVREMGRAHEVGFVDVTEYGLAGEAAARELSKGWLVAVTGRLKYREWQSGTAMRRHDYEVRGHIEFLSAPRGESAHISEIDQDPSAAV
ncbi:MAG: single-stranded DNA-binding protein [Solirubrobacteraceae bacterium]